MTTEARMRNGRGRAWTSLLSANRAIAFAAISFAVFAAGGVAPRESTAQEVGRRQPGAGEIGPSAQPQRQMTDAERRLDQTMLAARSFLGQTKAYRVVVESTWTSRAGDEAKTGSQRIVLTVAHPQFLRLEVQSLENPEAGLTVVSDGRSLWHFLKARRQFSRRPSENPRQDLEDDRLVIPALQSAGVEFLLQSDFHATLWAQVLRVEDRGEKQVDGARLHAFGVQLSTGQQLEATFDVTRAPLPVRIGKRTLVPVAQGQTFELTVETRLRWEAEPELPGDIFDFAPPQGATEVEDVGSRPDVVNAKSLIGRPAPDLRFKLLDNTDFSVAAQAGKSVVVCYFWATWATPSTNEIPALNEFVKNFSRRGVSLVAINVGERPEVVRAFVTQKGYAGPVALDPRAEGLATLRLTSMPAIIVIDRNGVVRDVQFGSGPRVRENIRQGLEALLMQ